MLEDYSFEIRSFSNRDSVTRVDPSVSFDEMFLDESRYSFCAGFEFLRVNTKTGESDRLAQVQVVLFDEDKIKKEGEDLAGIADCYSQDAFDSVDQYMRSKLYKNRCTKAGYKATTLCYLQQLFVYPEFRHHGVGTYLLDNMSQIISYLYNSPVSCIITTPEPQDEKEEVIEDPDGQMVKIMKKALRKANFKSLGKPSPVCNAAVYAFHY